MKLGIEINGTLRDINTQLLRYYKKEYDRKFPVSIDDAKEHDMINELVFEGKTEKNRFIYESYAYEIFGCAKTEEPNLDVDINEWLIDNEDDERDIEVEFFSRKEHGLTAQSTLFFLSKMAMETRNVWLPKDEENVWEKYDAIITSNKDTINEKKNECKSVLIIKKYNGEAISKADLYYKSLKEAISDPDLIKKVMNK